MRDLELVVGSLLAGINISNAVWSVIERNWGVAIPCGGAAMLALFIVGVKLVSQ